jgi:hypothetical protein
MCIATVNASHAEANKRKMRPLDARIEQHNQLSIEANIICLFDFYQKQKIFYLIFISLSNAFSIDDTKVSKCL